jgi:hypothetical protein
MAGAAVPLVTAGSANTDPVPDNAGGGPVGRVFDLTHFGARGDSETINTWSAASPRGTPHRPARTGRRLPGADHVRHAARVRLLHPARRPGHLDNVEVRFDQQDTRTAFGVVDVTDIDFHHTNADKVTGSPTFTLDDVDQFMVTTSRPVPDTRLAHVDHDEL